MAKKKSIGDVLKTKFTVDLWSPLDIELEKMSEVYGDKTKICRAALLMFMEADPEQKSAALRRLARYQEKHGIATKRGTRAG